MLTQTTPETERYSAALQTAQSWRTAAEQDNPAGPLYAAGVFAEVDIIEGNATHTELSGCTILYACTTLTNNYKC